MTTNLGFRIIGTVLLLLFLTTAGGCAVTEVAVPIGGSRADGTVQLAFEYGEFQRPKVNMEAAQTSAAERCAAWGYTDAEPFGGVITQCEMANGYGCLRYRATIEYQCTGPQD